MAIAGRMKDYDLLRATAVSEPNNNTHASPNPAVESLKCTSNTGKSCLNLPHASVQAQLLLNWRLNKASEEATGMRELFDAMKQVEAVNIKSSRDRVEAADEQHRQTCLALARALNPDPDRRQRTNRIVKANLSSRGKSTCWRRSLRAVVMIAARFADVAGALAGECKPATPDSEV